MKIKSLNHTQKSAFLSANNRIIRDAGQSYHVRAVTLGNAIIADAEPIPQGGKFINLFDRSAQAKKLRNLVESGSFS